MLAPRLLTAIAIGILASAGQPAGKSGGKGDGPANVSLESGGAGQPAGKPGGKAMGRPDAPIRIQLFSDYQCPGCKTLHDQIVRPLVTEYVNTGKVYLVNRELPLPAHAHAREAACLACAADKIGKYGQVADRLFLTQEKWAIDGNLAGPACSLLSPLEGKRVTELARSPEIAKMIDDDLVAARDEKITATPTMIITRLIRRYPVVGPVSYPVLRKFLDTLLN